MTSKARILLASLVLAGSGAALADMKVLTINVSALPYDLSPSKYDNSPSKYGNSISNYANSDSNYANSTSNYTNSSSNYANSRSGANRLIFDNTFVGYYVENGAGVTNFFSASGKRVLYNPEDSSAVFTNTGRYVGALALNSSKSIVLALTPEGVKALLIR